MLWEINAYGDLCPVAYAQNQAEGIGVLDSDGNWQPGTGDPDITSFFELDLNDDVMPIVSA